MERKFPDILTKEDICQMSHHQIRIALGDTDFTIPTHLAHDRVLLHVAQRAIFAEYILSSGTQINFLDESVHDECASPDDRLINQIQADASGEVKPWLGFGYIRF